MTDRLRVAVLVSGRGSNLEAIWRAREAGELPVELTLVATNKPDCRGIAFAREKGLPALDFPREAYPTRKGRDLALADALSARGVGLVVLAGYDRILHPDVIARFRGAIINTHNSLLPAFAGGLHAPADALAYGVKLTGCTVHFVTEDVDAGPIVSQRAVPVLDDDTQETLSARIRAAEHEALPAAIRLFAERRLRIDGRRVRILPTEERGVI